jgi:hypothetical protein
MFFAALVLVMVDLVDKDEIAELARRHLLYKIK